MNLNSVLPFDLFWTKFRPILSVFLVFLGITFGLDAQPTPPDVVTARIAESDGTGCTNLTDCASETICFDLFFSVNEPGWSLQSYNIWVDYGPDAAVLSFLNDNACHHTNAGDTDLSQFGLYRVFGAQSSLHLEADVEVIIHNICFAIEDFGGLDGLPMSAGGNYWSLKSSVNIVDQNNSNFTDNPDVALSPTLNLSPENISCMGINPNVLHDCNDGNINLFSDPVDGSGASVLDCEPFTYSWTGPAGFSSNEQNPVILAPSTDYIGTYNVEISGATGCLGIESLLIDQNNCTAFVPLALDELNFSGKAREGFNYLEWNQQINSNLDHFVVERKTNTSDNFVQNGIVKVSDQPTFSFKDENVTANTIYYYRLSLVEKGGEIKYSKVISLINRVVEPLTLNTYPNPFYNEIELSFNLLNTSYVNMEILDVNGIRVISLLQSEQMLKGEQIINANLELLEPGVYFIKMNSNDKIFTKRIIKM